MKIGLGILVGGVCGLLAGIGFSGSLYWLTFILTYGQGEFSATGLLVWLSLLASPLLVLPLVGAIVGAKLARRPSVQSTESGY